jgi:hypothetical protein
LQGLGHFEGVAPTKEKKMKGILIFVSAAALIIALVLGIYWLAWSAWCYVLPYFWASGPQNIIRPDFWMFVIAALLLSWVGRLLFKPDTKAK